MKKKLISLGLIIAFLAMAGGTATVLDYTGLINLRDRLPDRISEIQAVQNYREAADFAQMTPSQRHRRLMAEEQHQYQLQRQSLAMLQQELEETLNKMAEAQKKIEQERELFAEREAHYESRKQEYEQARQEHERFEQDVAAKEADQLLYEDKLSRLVKIYERMDPDAAAEVFNNMSRTLSRDLLFRMREKNAAAIMDEMNPEVAAEIAQFGEVP